MGGGPNRVDSFPAFPGVESPLSYPAQGLEHLGIHKVPLPQRKSIIPVLKKELGEVFFPDDPLRQFKNQPFLRKLFLGLQYLFPIIQWGSDYDMKLFKSDVISGLTIASLAIPQGISYAKLANLPPIIGLYSSFVPPLIYTVLGSSRHLAVGPVSVASLVMGSMLREVVSPDKEPTLYLHLAFTATFFAGVFQASLGFLRLGFIVDFLSKPTLTGFMGGSAIIVSLQQLKGLLGIRHFTTKMGFLPVMLSVFKHRTEWTWETVLMGFSFLAFLLITRHIGLRRPKLFWVSAAAPLTSVILSTIFVFAFKDQKHGIQTIGHLQRGLNPTSINMLSFQSSHLSLALKTGLVTGILSLTEGIAVGRTFASLKNYQIDGNKEMTAIGIMNIVGSCTSCYVTTGSFSRSAVNYNAGAKTALSNIVMASVVLITMLFLMPLFYYTPNVILSVIIITAVIGLIDFGSAVRLWKVDKLDFIACLCAFFGVLLISVQIGLALASYRSIVQYREAVRIPSILVLAIQSPIYFANSTYLQERIMRWVREEEERNTKTMESDMKFVLLDISAVTSVDTSGIHALLELKKMLNSRSIQLVLANPVGDVAEKLCLSKAWEEIDLNAFLCVKRSSPCRDMHVQSRSRTAMRPSTFRMLDRNTSYECSLRRLSVLW
ncbi:hypothetical protein HPP92_008694 [Vanilla planifolia]|uniref:STAS domain-containing protein n=1 Tax=Vanilla planifolia TaxID=51239 RepID=A0A835V5M2_VANPL|nr:hypothetical protein HPP92_008694 [Vanilla planifolia]